MERSQQGWFHYVGLPLVLPFSHLLSAWVYTLGFRQPGGKALSSVGHKIVGNQGSAGPSLSCLLLDSGCLECILGCVLED